MVIVAIRNAIDTLTPFLNANQIGNLEAMIAKAEFISLRIYFRKMMSNSCSKLKKNTHFLMAALIQRQDVSNLLEVHFSIPYLH